MQKKRGNVYHGDRLMPWATGTAVKNAQGYVFLSGVGGRDPNTHEVAEGAYAQTMLAMQTIKQRLEEFGTSLENICHMWTYLVGPDFPLGVANDPKCQERRRALDEFWRDNCPEFLTNPPAATLIGVAGLNEKKMLLEIVVIAAIP